MWSFVQKKANKAWVWLAMDGRSGRIVGLYVGRRDEEAAKALWASLPKPYRDRAICFTDHWAAYEAAIPRGRHVAVSKRSGLMNRLERFNNTLRQRLGRLTRRTLSFSKSRDNHIGCLRFFIDDHNRHLAITH